MLDALANSFAWKGSPSIGELVWFFSRQSIGGPHVRSHIFRYLSDVAALTTYQVFFVFAAELTNRIPFPHTPIGVGRRFHSGSSWSYSSLSSTESRLDASALAYAVGLADPSVDPCTNGVVLAGRVRAESSKVVLANFPYLLAFPLLKPVPAALLPI